MTNTLSKDKTFISYTPGVAARAGSPAIPATPARVVTELKPFRIEVPSSAMEVLFGRIDRATGQMIYSTYWAANASASLVSSPLVKLRSVLNRPGLTAAQAHYSEVLALVEFGGGAVQIIMPVTWSSAWIEEMRWATTIIPANPGKAAVPAVAGSPAVMTYDMHLGWNAGARSEQIVEPNTNFDAQFTIGRDIGAAVGLARASTIVGATRRSGYRHIVSGLLMSEGRVRMIRDGTIVRASDGSTLNVLENAAIETFRCVFIDGVCQWSHGALGVFATHVLEEKPEELTQEGGGGPIAAPIPIEQRYVLDAVLYAADDYVDSPSITLRSPTPGSMEGVAKSRPLHVAGRMGSPTALSLPLRAMTLRAGNDYADGVLALPAMSIQARAGGVGSAALVLSSIRGMAGTIALGSADLRVIPLGIEMDVEGDYWQPTYAIASLVMHPMTLSAVLVSGGVMNCELQMPQMFGRMSESVYGEAILLTEPLQLAGRLNTGTGPVDMVERMLPFNEVRGTVYVTVVLTERVRTRDTVDVEVLAVASMLEKLEVDASASITQRALAFLLEQIGAMGPTRALTFRVDDAGEWHLVDDSEGWAVNTETGGSSRYTGFGFDSFATVNGRHLGVRANGVYLLEGDSDAGQPIHAGVHLGLQDFGTSQLKQLSNVYLGVSATGGLFVKVGLGEGEEKQEFVYAARRVDSHLKTQRFDLGRGLRSNYFSFELVNDDGAGFEIEKIEFVAVASNRRI